VTLDLSQISRLGFGVSGPHKCDAVDRPQTIRLIHEAIDLGISVFDTAPKYGNGEAESRLGEALKTSDRDKLFIVTKAGIVDETDRRDFSPTGIRASLQGSLKRLGLDHVDALLLQGAASLELNADLYEVLSQLKSEGLVRYVGASGRDDELDLPINEALFDIIMAPNYAGMPSEQVKRLQDARNAGRRIFAIEAKNGAQFALKLSFDKTGRWYLKRQFKRWADRQSGASTPPKGKLSILDAFQWALDSELSDCLLAQTTKSEHLKQLAEIAHLDAAAPGA
jgi:aryl-alcohol dehydrogenase-like predicted oxidoreductase